MKNEYLFDFVKDNQNLLIETERLILEPIIEAHAPLLWSLLQDEKLYRFIPQDPPTLESLQQRYKKWSARTSPDKKEIWLNWAVCAREQDHYIGHFQAGFSEKKGFSIAYTIGSRFQGQGYATEGMASVINFLRVKMNATHIKSWVDTRNEPSIRLMNRLGIEQIQVIKNADNFKGSISHEFVFELKTKNLQ